MRGFQLRQGQVLGTRPGYTAPFNPGGLFANGELGVWYDPADSATTFQYENGVAPAVGGNTLGLLLDKKFGLVRGGELLTNGSFVDASGWRLSAGWSITGGKLVASGAVQNANAYQAGVVTAGKKYEITYTVDAVTSGALQIMLRSGWVGPYHTAGDSGTFHIFLTAGASGDVLVNSGVAGTSAVLDNISVRELPGDHAYQTTATLRPVLRDNPRRIDYDGVDNQLNVTFSASLGSACTVARAIPGVGAQILTAQTVGASFVDTVDNCGLLVVNRALTAPETAGLTAYLNGLVGV